MESFESYKKRSPDAVLYKENPDNAIYEVLDDMMQGLAFSFDKKTIYHFFSDYPHNLTKEQKAIFDREYADWLSYFPERV